MGIPFVLLADADGEHTNRFESIFEKEIAYATVVAKENGKSLLHFLSTCPWDHLPSLILLTYRLSDMTAPDLLRELLPDTRFLAIPKVILTDRDYKTEIDECKILGVRHFLKKDETVFECESNVRRIDTMLKSELAL